MLRRLGFLFAALAIFSIAGGQWAVLQSIAWTGMLHDYTQCTGSFAAAVEQTFDGAHPCELCREIASAKAKEQKEKSAAPGAKEDTKAKAMVADAVVQPVAPAAMLLTRVWSTSSTGPDRADQPPTPPPRGGACAA